MGRPLAAGPGENLRGRFILEPREPDPGHAGAIHQGFPPSGPALVVMAGAQGRLPA